MESTIHPTLLTAVALLALGLIALVLLGVGLYSIWHEQRTVRRNNEIIRRYFDD